MGKKDSGPKDVSHLNALIPTDLHRRLMIAKANTGKSIQELVADAVRLLLDKVEANAKGGGGRKQGA